ncbi:hypothetical protein [Bacillus sp. V2I10]|uniref:hypothetical protein n=1 Tax=Bacillus sp. V2I10 TaxID=3042276 RepID=UPI0027833F43|nr:hypothetical protein [Bacillus sp. V2I10]MDQ0862145.1 hypothetical protein [Bacillus sp. V2I10]
MKIREPSLGGFFLVKLNGQLVEEGLLILFTELFKLTDQAPDAVRGVILATKRLR